MIGLSGQPRFIRARQQGSSLIEILVSVVVVSIGLLGVASLQTYGLKNNNNAYLRTQATAQANDMMDRMRLNRAAAIGGDYDTAIGDAAEGTSTIAAADLTAWKASLDAVLPSGDGSVTCDSDACSVTVQWSDGDADSGDFNDTSVSVNSRL